MVLLLFYRGTGTGKTAAFRAAYSKIADQRLFSVSTKFVAMTATSTAAVEKEVTKLLQMTGYKVVRCSPAKKN